MIAAGTFAPRAQRGFTLIELMVAMTIGLLLTIVVANLFLGSRATYQTTDELSRMQENIRFVYQLLTRTVHLAGYKSAPNSFTTGANGIFIGANLALNGTEGGGTVSDSLTVRFQGSGTGAAPDNTIFDCEGRAIDAGIMAVNTFTIAVGANLGNALYCDNGIGARIEVVPDVENMQILYGEDTNNDLVADRYVTLPNVTNRDAIVAVRIALLFRTTNVSASVLRDSTTTYDLNGTAVGPFNDTRIRRVITMNINLRNRTP